MRARQCLGTVQGWESGQGLLRAKPVCQPVELALPGPGSPGSSQQKQHRWLQALPGLPAGGLDLVLGVVWSPGHCQK